MCTKEGEQPFIPPLPRPVKEIWHASYRLSRWDFVAAVEHVTPYITHPIEGMRWEYEGFRRNRLFLWQPGDVQRELPPIYVEFGMRIEDDLITIYANTDNDVELQLFRRLTTELDEVTYVAEARVTPCTRVGHQPPLYSPQWA